MPDVVTDTHGLIWYLRNDPRLGPAARQRFLAGDRGELVVYVPTICLVEIIYLEEKGRILPGLITQLETDLRAGTTGLQLVNLTIEVANTLVQVPRTAIPDMPDRIIAATALHLGLALISRDRRIQLSAVPSIW